MSRLINTVHLLGNLGKDPEVKYTPKGTAVASVSLATNERYKDSAGEWKDRTEWHTLILWNRLAEIAKEYLHKGSKIAVAGSLRTRSWEKDGAKHYRTEIIVDDLVMCDGAKQQPANSTASKDSGPITDEDIPF